MAADNNYNEILEEVCEKLNNIDSIKGLDMLDIKNSVESIENLITDAQAKLNFQEIKEKLENIAFQVDSCNETLLKDLYNDINQLKEKSESFNAHLENIQNVQNLSLTNAEFEEFQKQQLDLALKTNENIFSELKQIKENSKVVDNTEGITNIDKKLTDLHKTLTVYIEQLASKIDSSAPGLDEIGAIMTDVASIGNKNIKETNNLIKVLESNFNKFKNQEFSDQISKISEIYDSLNIIHAWIEKVGFLNKSIENVYARLGANIDFDDVSEKIDIIYDNITALNEWTMKIDNIDGNIADFQSKITTLSSLTDDTKNITKTLKNIKDKLDTTFTEELDFDDISDKMDIIYENLTALNDWAVKIDNMSEQVSSIKTKMDTEDVDSKINDLSGEIGNISEKVTSINTIVEGDIASKVNNISEKVDIINNVFEEDVISSKIDLIYDNISLLNDWVKKIDDIAQRSEELDNKFVDTNDKFSSKMDEISGILSDASALIDNIPGIKDKLERLSDELYTITRSTKNDTESYIYTLLDIESDFLKLHKFLEEKTQTTSDVVNELKERFEELNDDISSISKRTNKLILSADDANKEFKIHLEAFKNTIVDLETKKQEFDPETKFKAITEKLSGLNLLVQNSLSTGKNLNEAFIYLAEWIDATGSILNSMLGDIASVKSQTEKVQEIDNISAQISGLQEQITTAIQNNTDAAEKRINEELSLLKSRTAQAIKSSGDLTDGRIGAEIADLKEYINNTLAENKSSVQNQTLEQLNDLKQQIAESIRGINDLSDTLSSYKNDDVSEIKSLLTGIIVQLNTALKPDIDSLNERIDKLTEENQNKFSELETLLKEKVEIQSKQINALEEKIDSLYGRIDKLIETVNETNKNDEIKDILNYITTQVAAANETISAHPKASDEIKKLAQEQINTITAIKEVMTGQKNIADKLASFDGNVQKIVSYIEED